MNSALQHATIVEIDGRGILIRGASGSGKSALAFTLLSRCRSHGIESALVADDYASVALRGDGLEAMVPVAIAGLIEIRGYGIVRLDQSRWKPSTELALAVSLGPIKDADRVADPDRVFPLHGVTLPELALPESSVEIAANAVLAWLGLAGRVI